jgi:hypothetical protein
MPEACENIYQNITDGLPVNRPERSAFRRVFHSHRFHGWLWPETTMAS